MNMNMDVNINAADKAANSIVTNETSQEIRFRCPHCQKLYRTGQDVFDGVTPEFDCSSCEKTFFLTRNLDSFGLYATNTLNQASFATCPKCSNLKPNHADECVSCGVFASKYLELQKAESPMLFELNKLWAKVIANFDVDQFHQDFLNKCHQSMALNFAFQKYSELQKTMGFDTLCDKYIKQIELRLDSQLKSTKYNEAITQVPEVQRPMNFMQILFLGMGSLGMLLLIYNRYIPTFPNLNGLVLMLTVLAFGVGLFSNTKTQIKL